MGTETRAGSAGKPFLTISIIILVALFVGFLAGQNMDSLGSSMTDEAALPDSGNNAQSNNASLDAFPDWSGVWSETQNTVFDHSSIIPQGASSGTEGAREFPPYSEEWEEKYLANLALVAQGLFPDPITPCGIPAGFPRIFNLPDVYEFVVRPEETWILSENGPNVMRIYTDGRDHPPEDEIWPLFTGDSVGHWEGDTLVFSTISVKNEGTILDRTGLVLSNEMTAITRMRKVDGVIEVEMTISDPQALTEAWVVTSYFEKLPVGARVYDYSCGENNRNPVMSDGYTVTLGPDGEPLEDL